MDILPLLHPQRPVPRLRPLKALKYFMIFLKDKEDSIPAFHVFDALTGKSLIKDLKKFAATPEGEQRIKERRYLPPIMDDHEWIDVLPENTVGAAYLKYVRRNNFSALSLAATYDIAAKELDVYDDVVEWYNNRLRDTHDILHALTTYGRDAIGETCIQAFSFGQNRSLGALLMAYMGAFEAKRVTKCSVPVFAAIHEARKNGKAADLIVKQDIVKLMHEPIDQARKRLGVPEPTAYNNVMSALRSNGIDPYEILMPG